MTCDVQPFPQENRTYKENSPPPIPFLGQHSPVDKMLCWRDCTQLAALPLAGPSTFLMPQFPHKNKPLHPVCAPVAGNSSS